MAFHNDGSIGNWVCYVHADGSMACCVQTRQSGPEHRSGRTGTRGFDTPEEAFEYLHRHLNQPVQNIRFFVSSPEQFYLTNCLGGARLPLERHLIHKGISPVHFNPY